ncbi:radical SAM protein [Methanolapillus ohkumae]|uniref:Biotin synthase n=1 Tax=Methanolapillus ohkumae TaxID=3028298 RepID=A0AA96V446_9EURY|nr:Biotin synthase [Methanosarcinaceae archaeon Am2]
MTLPSKTNSLPLTTEKKAFLLSIGTANVDHGLIPATRKSTAGPSAGSEGSVFIYSGGHRIRLSLDKNSPVRIQKIDSKKADSKKTDSNNVDFNYAGSNHVGSDEIVVLYENEPIVTGKIEKVLAHCPEQAYINLSEKCIFNCKYCTVPLLQGHTKSKSETLQIIQEAFDKGKGNVSAISITSGVEESPEGELARVMQLMPELIKYGVPIGVSIYVTKDGAQHLKDAGAVEVKFNVEAASPEIFERVCPGLSYEDVFEELKNSVAIFGKGRVYSNLIVGLGESDSDITKTVEDLAKIGVIACLRPVFENKLRSGECFMERPSKERLLKLYEIQKRICEKYDLHPEKSETMCSKCGGCDLVPFSDD